MIEQLNEFESYIISKGVGSNDRVSDSVKSYISYLNGVSRHLGININPRTLSLESDVIILAKHLSEGRKVSEKTIKNYKSAMKQYIQMVHDRGLLLT